MIKVGITGGISSGKTTISKIFNSLGVPVFSTDLSARNAENKKIVKDAFVEIIGPKCLVDGKLDRTYMRSKVFVDKEILNKITLLIGEYVTIDLNNFYLEHKDVKYVLIESAILYECGLDKKMDLTINVSANKELRLKRAMLRDNVSEEEILNKMNNQFSDDEREKLSNYNIINEFNSLDKLLDIVTNIHNDILKNK